MPLKTAGQGLLLCRHARRLMNSSKATLRHYHIAFFQALLYREARNDQVRILEVET